MNAYMEKINAALEIPHIKNIINLDDFYYQKAKDKFEEFLRMDTSNLDLPFLITVTKQKPFSFERLLNSYATDSNEYKLLLLAGQSISYFDSNAAMKNRLNEYEDKRVISRAFVRQNYWVESLLRYKSGVDVNGLPENIRNTILFIQDPENNICMVSEKHRKAVLDMFFENADEDLFKEFYKTGIRANNPLNNGVLYSNICYSVRKLWDKSDEEPAYWLGGSGSSGELTQAFIDNGVFGIRFGQEDMTELLTDPSKLKDHISNISDSAARSAFELFLKMKTGDKIALKSSFAKGNESILRIKAIGTILDNMENACVYSKELGHTIPVEWQLIEPFADYELGTYRRTVHQVTKKEDIETIFYGKNQNLENEFKMWLPTQRSRGETGFYTQAAVSSYSKALREDICRELTVPDLHQTNLFYQTNPEEFKKLHKIIRNLPTFNEVNINIRNRAPSAAMQKYEDFLVWRENKNSSFETPNAEPFDVPTEEIIDVINDELPRVNNTDFHYNVGISKEQWFEMLDNLIITQNDIELLRKWLYFNGQATCAKIGKTYNAHPSSYIKPVVSMARRINEHTDCKTRLDENGNVAWWNIPFVGKYINGGEHFEWTIRPEFYEALLSKGITPLEPPVLVKYSKDNFLSEVYMTSEKYDDIAALLERKKNIILQGAPGVGKSYLAKRLAYSIIGYKDTNKVEMVQFHQSYSYEDFIEGFRPGAKGNFEIKQGIFYRFCEKAKNDTGNKYYFIVDEINRGNLSKIMGELMLLLENDKRGEEFAMPLTYSGESFYVPENIYIIGMMNTADRSLAMIDYALRRRFSFIPIEPAFDNEVFISDFRANYLEADTVIEKMRKLNTFITDELDSGHQIGHSYFCSIKPFTDKDIEGIFKYEILELLREYFFDNSSKLDEALRLL